MTTTTAQEHATLNEIAADLRAMGYDGKQAAIGTCFAAMIFARMVGNKDVEDHFAARAREFANA